MAPASLKDLYFDELEELYDAETQTIRTLPRLEEAARRPELRAMLRKHCDQSRLHLERLDLIFTHWGERRHEKACAGIAGIVQKADSCLNQQTTGDTRDAAIIGVATTAYALLRVPVVRPKVTETTALGAAYLAGLAVGYWKDQQDVRANWEVQKAFEPRMSQDQVSHRRTRWTEALKRSLDWEQKSTLDAKKMA